jgi:type IV pilus assembly protein PilA
MNTLLKKRNKQKGFTLIELMVTIAIVGILAAIAVPAYQYYITKARFSALLVAASEMKPLVSECLAAENCNTALGTDGLTYTINKDAVNTVTAKQGITKTEATILVKPRNYNGITTADEIVLRANTHASDHVTWEIHGCTVNAAKYISGATAPVLNPDTACT